MTLRKTLVPNASDTATNYATGAAGNWQALADDDDSSFVTLPDSETELVQWEMDTYTPADPMEERLWRYRLVARFRTEPRRRFVTFVYGVGFSFWKAIEYNAPSLGSGLSPIFQLTSAWKYTDVEGGELDQAFLDGLEGDVRNEDRNIFYSEIYMAVFHLKAEVEYMLQPVATLYSPGNGATGVPVQSITFKWTTEEIGTSEELQTKYELFVFTEAVANGGGFDVDTEIAADNYVASKAGSGTAQESTILTGGPDSLDYGSEYVAFVRVAKKDPSNATWWSEWSNPTPFTTNERPEVSITSPADTATLTNTNRPLVTWDYSDTEGDPQDYYQVVVETGGGSTPGSGTEILNSGLVTGSDEQYQVGIPLDNLTTFDLYVQARSSDVNAASDWDHTTFDTDITAPPAPAISLSPQPGYMMGSITQAASGAIDEAFSYTLLERSTDAGTTWIPVRGWWGRPWVTSGSEDWADWEAPFNVDLTYRAVTVNNELGTEISSPYSNQPTDMVESSKVWVYAVGQELTLPPVQAVIQDRYVNRTKSVKRAVHSPLGNGFPVVTKSPTMGERFTLSFLCEGSSYSSLFALLESDLTLLVKAEDIQWYCEIESDLNISDYVWDRSHGNYDPDLWLVGPVQFIEVERPDVAS